MTTPGPDREDVAAERRELLVGDLDQPDPEVAEQLPQPDRQERQVDDREVVGDRRDDRHEVDQLGRAAPVRDVEDADVATDERGELARPRPSWSAASGRCRTGPGRSQNVSPPSIVPGASMRPSVGMPAAVVQASMAAGSRRPVRLARPERDRAAVGHQQRVEGVDEVRASSSSVVEHVDARAERREQLDERVVLAPRDVEVDRVEEAVRRVVEGGPERRARAA